ncbi:hypothetical protein M569_10300, partial [Genlisea aurea]
MLDVAPDSSFEKINWKDVVRMSEQVSNQATNVGMLYTGRESPPGPGGIKALEDIMASYFNILQGFLFLAHGSLVGAGFTFSSCIHKSVKQVVDASFSLFQEAVSSYDGNGAGSTREKIPQLVGAVWDACAAVKKTPTSNVAAIGRAMAHVAVSVKDVLCEIKEHKPMDEKTTSAADDSSDGGDDLGNDFSPEEMKIVQSASDFVSQVLAVIRELIRSMLRHETPHPDHSSLEKLLKLCQDIGVEVDELGACLYPPQEIPGIQTASGKISSLVSELETEANGLHISTDDFHTVCSRLRKLEPELNLVI